MASPLPLAEVKAHLSELVNRVSTQHERVTITVHGKDSPTNNLRFGLYDL